MLAFPCSLSPPVFLPRPASVDVNGVNVSWVDVKPIVVLITLDRRPFSSMLVRIITRLPLSLPPSLPPSFSPILPPLIKQYARVQAIEKQRALMESGQGVEAGGHGGGVGH